MPARYNLRTATLSDVDSVAALLMEDPELKSRSAAGWLWLFRDNPANRSQEHAPDMGWILERDGELCGYLGNVHLEYVLDGKSLRAATSTSYYVRAEARPEAARLLSAFFRQPGVDLFVSTTACAPDGALYRMFKAAVPADASFEHGLIWIANDAAFLEDLLSRVRLPLAARRAVAAITAPVMHTTRALAGYATAPRTDRQAIVVNLGPQDIDERFDRLWEELRQQPGLQVCRAAHVLRWYLSDPDAGAVPSIFAVLDGDDVVAYAAVALHRMETVKMRQLRLIDLVVAPRRESTLPVLIDALIEHASRNGAGLLYSPPCGAFLTNELKKLRPRLKHRGDPSHFLRAVGGDTTSLASAGTWRATGLDGDTPFGIVNQPA